MSISNIKPILSKYGPQSSRVLAALLCAFGVAALAVAILAGSALAAGSNLVKNGSFEGGTHGNGIPNKWSGTNLTTADKRDCNQSAAGDCSFKMVGNGVSKLFKQEIAVGGLAGDEFTLSAWTKGKDVAFGGGEARVYVYFNHTDGSANSLQFGIPAGTTPWSSRYYSPATASENYDSIRIQIQFSIDSGKIWVDKVKLVPIP